jgi:hypothetical protein
MELLERIERYLKEYDVSATRFGRRALGDPRFVLELRKGRIPRPRTIARLESYLDLVDPGQGGFASTFAFPARTAGCSVLRPRARAQLPRSLPASQDARSSWL